MGHRTAAGETPDELTISLSIEALGAGALEPQEEKATFGLLSVTANDRLLTGVQDAEHFDVSELTARTQLVNRGRIDRENAPDVVARGAWR